MTWQARVYKILIASPRDLEKERKVISEVIHEWNDLHADKNCVMLQAIMWEKHTTPELGNRPQEIVNKQIVEDCDILIGTFWTRLGTPTGVAESGTIEEIEKFDSAKKPVLLYFSTRSIPPDSIDSKQLELLREKKKEYQERGLTSSYKSIPDLQKKLGFHIENTIQKLQTSTSQTEKEPKIPKDKPSEPKQGVHLNMSKEELEERLKRLFNYSFSSLKEKWNIEKASEPLTTEEGAFILIGFRDELAKLTEVMGKVYGTELQIFTNRIINFIAKIDEYSGFVEYTDSRYGRFWISGDEVLEKIDRIKKYLESPEEYPLDIQTTTENNREVLENPFAT